jgi:phosphohistidine phosphatase SixA
MMARCVLFLGWLLLLTANAAAQHTVFMVRHAERADTEGGAAPTMGTDPTLSAAGHARAAQLATLLKDADVRAIFVTEYKRTQETAAPLAKALGITPTIIPAKDTPALIEKLKAAPGRALVVGHSNSVPDVIKGMGVPAAPAIADAEYDNLFILTETRQLIRLRYR